MRVVVPNGTIVKSEEGDPLPLNAHYHRNQKLDVSYEANDTDGN